MSHIYAMSNTTTLVKIENKARKQRRKNTKGGNEMNLRVK